jgi:hypothetical protein
MRIELTPKERQIIAAHRQRIAEAEAARNHLVVLCTIIIERAGGEAAKPWNLTDDGAALEEVSDAVAQ